MLPIGEASDLVVRTIDRFLDKKENIDQKSTPMELKMAGPIPNPPIRGSRVYPYNQATEVKQRVPYCRLQQKIGPFLSLLQRKEKKKVSFIEQCLVFAFKYKTFIVKAEFKKYQLRPRYF